MESFMAPRANGPAAMTKHKSHLTLTALAAGFALFAASPTWAQVSGGATTANVHVTEATRLAMGWSVKHTLMGKTIYSDEGQKVGTVDDLIVSPDRNISYVIVGAGGFVGLGRHDVAIPVGNIQDKAGKLVMAGANKDTIKAMPEFTYATDTAKLDAFVATAEHDIAKGKARVAELEEKASESATEAKASIDLQIAALRRDVQSAEAKLGELKQASAERWQEFEAGVSAATARVRESIHSATG